ncbi:aspartic proteinase CDR1-like [Humulus lupulus]|uniref:aspartic proteinase CDR1-like n=1 Tax=Humulus lupulus TaxID=3486 RepID=UPI002B4093F2|nr:aspartic proteinase CDR1-like [Humulus lupulus]
MSSAQNHIKPEAPTKLLLPSLTPNFETSSFTNHTTPHSFSLGQVLCPTPTHHLHSPPMGRPSFILLIYCLIESGLLYPSFASPSSETFHGSDSRRHPMVLPLYLSPPKSSSHRREFEGRRLHKSDQPRPNAHMRLYDDLLSNGYYTTRLQIGTPPQEFALIVDTGSTVTYVPCSDCEHCGEHQDPRFQPNSSKTYEPVKCNMNCNCDKDGVQCTYERRYAEMSSSSGVLGEDVISFGNESTLVPQRAVFGCENVETGDLYSQRADGIIGLGRGRLSVMDQLVDKGVIGDSFSLCYGGMGVGGGAMILGGISSPPDMVFTHSDPYRSPYYNIDLKEIHVAGKPLKLSPKVFDRKHGTVLDSGTTYAYLPEEAFYAFKGAIMRELGSLKQIHGPDPHYNDICFSGAGRNVTQLSTKFPQVDMVFSNGQKLSLSPENYLFRHTKVSGAYCLGIFKNADQTTLLGGILVRNTLVTYDRENDKIGFWKTNCSELWKSLNYLSSPPPNTPLDSDNLNGSTEIPPSVASDGLPKTDFPGHIYLEMKLGVNKSVKLNFTELTGLIAKGLEVKVSQVHLTNLKVEGNSSFITWAVFPVSNTTAMSIILRLKEPLQLPEKFGSCQVKLKVEPQKKQSWWKQHHIWTVTIGVTVTLAFGLLTLGVWLFWRHTRQKVGSYEPVDAIIAEQELQPLEKAKMLIGY